MCPLLFPAFSAVLSKLKKVENAGNHSKMGVISLDFTRSYFEIIIDTKNGNYRYASLPL